MSNQGYDPAELDQEWTVSSSVFLKHLYDDFIHIEN